MNTKACLKASYIKDFIYENLIVSWLRFSVVELKKVHYINNNTTSVSYSSVSSLLFSNSASMVIRGDASTC